MGGFIDKKPGEYRDGFVNLTNTDIALPSAQEVPKRMAQLIKEMNEVERDPIHRCALDHFHFEIIHPFFDGNGRTGRLLMMTQLLSRKLPPAVIRIEDRYQYYWGLEKCSLKEYNTLPHVVAEGILEGFKILMNQEKKSKSI